MIYNNNNDNANNYLSITVFHLHPHYWLGSNLAYSHCIQQDQSPKVYSRNPKYKQGCYDSFVENFREVSIYRMKIVFSSGSLYSLDISHSCL